MKKMFLLFSHRLTESQIQEATEKFGVGEFVYLPDALQSLWSRVPTDIESLREYIEPIKAFVKLNAKKGDIVLVQGDFGMVFSMVIFSKKIELIPVYATTERKIEEYVENGQSVKKSVFEFRRFREYE